MDCLRHDMIDVDLDGSPLMPELKRFRDDSLSFSNAFASAPSTHFAVPTILTGILPFTTDDKQGIYDDVPYIPQILKEKGYRTMGYTTNIVTSKIYGYSRGFDLYRDFLESGDVKWSYRMRKKFVYFLEKLPPKKRTFFDIILFPYFQLSRVFGWELNPQETNYEINDMMDGKNIIESFSKDLETLGDDEKLFSFIHFVDTHAPYAPPGEYMEGLIDEENRNEDFLRDLFQKVYSDESSILEDPKLLDLNWKLYLSTCRYQDKLFSDMLKAIQKRNTGKPPVIIVMADHGEAFGDHGYLQHRRTRHSGVHIRIPLIINGPGFEQGFNDGLADETDILPIITKVSNGEDAEDVLDDIDERERIVTLGYSKTVSLTSKRVRFINDDEGPKLFKFSDIEERTSEDIDDELVNFFMKQITKIRNSRKKDVGEKTLLRSRIRKMGSLENGGRSKGTKDHEE